MNIYNNIWMRSCKSNIKSKINKL